MNGWLFGLGIVCLLYYGWLWMISMDFAVVWLGLGILAVLGGLFGKTAWNHLPGAARAGCIAVFGAGILIFLVVECQICLHMWEKPDTEVPVVIVLGAQVKGTRPSRALGEKTEKGRSVFKGASGYPGGSFRRPGRRGRHHGSPVHVRLADRARHCFQMFDFGRALYQHGGKFKIFCSISG